MGMPMEETVSLLLICPSTANVKVQTRCKFKKKFERSVLNSGTTFLIVYACHGGEIH